MTQFVFANSTERVPGNGQLPAEFTIKAPPSTDIWSKPPSMNRFNAPILYQTVPLASFKSVRVSFHVNWMYKYDQGGLIIVLNRPDGQRQWVKTGIEFTHGKPYLSTVSKDRWADWSLLPAPSDCPGATIEMVREADNSLWVYLVQGMEKVPVRELTWVFEDESIQDCWIGVYAARPSNEGGDLIVDFRHLAIEQVS